MNKDKYIYQGIQNNLNIRVIHLLYDLFFFTLFNELD